MDSFLKQLLKRIPRHGEGLLGVGGVHASAVYVAVLVSEFISGLLRNQMASLNKSVYSFVTALDFNALIYVGIFIVIWVFLGAIAFAGSTRYLMGCVDPEHIAQRTFSIGIRLYTKKMIAYTAFLGVIFLITLGIASVIFMTAGMFGFGYAYILPCMLLLAFIFIMFMSKISFTPMFMIQGKSLFAAVSKSWVATGKRFWLINLIRLILISFVMLPVIFKYLLNVTIYLPSIDIWPYAALIVVGFEEIFVAIGFQEYELEHREPIVSKSFAQKDLQQLETYTRADGYEDPQGSMEF
jgi:hypothetical protein